MALIQWSNGLKLNIAEIDLQHHKLVTMINDLNDAMRLGRGKDVLGKILGGLIDYAGTHFNTEERYFDQFAYFGMREHKNEHAAFVRKICEFRDGFEKGKLGVSSQVLNFLSDWLKHHILGSDRKYVPFFVEKGLK